MRRCVWVILQLVVFLCACYAVMASHDASTVTAMLARIGLGPLAHCYSNNNSRGEEPLEGQCLQLGLEKNMPKCWGYERNCSKEESLFVPQCEPPAQPW